LHQTGARLRATFPRPRLPAAGAVADAGAITDGVARGKGREALKVAPPAADPKADPREAKPFAHPKYWAAVVLIGDPN
jgi:CHAT domain-containing protein